MVKDQDSVSDTTAVQVGEEDATEKLEMENIRILLPGEETTQQLQRPPESF